MWFVSSWVRSQFLPDKVPRFFFFDYMTLVRFEYKLKRDWFIGLGPIQ